MRCRLFIKRVLSIPGTQHRDGVHCLDLGQSGCQGAILKIVINVFNVFAVFHRLLPC